MIGLKQRQYFLNNPLHRVVLDRDFGLHPFQNIQGQMNLGVDSPWGQNQRVSIFDNLVQHSPKIISDDLYH